MQGLPPELIVPSRAHALAEYIVVPREVIEDELIHETDIRHRIGRMRLNGQAEEFAPEIVRPFEKSPETDAVDCSLNVVQLIQYVEAERAASRSMSFVHAVRL